MPTTEHKAHDVRAACAILTASDTRTEQDDTSGQRISELLQAAGHSVSEYRIVRDEPGEIHKIVRSWLGEPALDAVLLNGGTGIAPRDTTFEAIRKLLDKEIEGFGELFRMLSYAEIGSAAMLSRAIAGIASGKLVVSMPGSTAAVELAMQKLVIPELAHVLHLLGRGRESVAHRS